MAEYLQLLENPRRSKSRNNPVGFDEFGNPIFVGSSNPRRRRKKRRNPMAKTLAMPSTMRGWTQGIDFVDAGSAAGGLAASTMLPGMFVKTADTGWQKTMKLLASLGCALGAGAIGKAIISDKAGKAAIIGGIAGSTAMAIGLFTGFQIGTPARRIATRRIGETLPGSPAQSRDEETVNVIIP